ncbi:hypothetical protein D3C81_835550 [compost metagenome]
MPAPMTQGMQFGRHMLGLKVFQTDAMCTTPVHPIIRMIEFDADIAHQPAPRHVFARMPGKPVFGEILRHVQRKLLNHRPAPDQVLTHGSGAEFVITHAQVKFMFDNPALALAAILNELLCPGRITCSFHEWSGSVECVDHCSAPFDL